LSSEFVKKIVAVVGESNGFGCHTAKLGEIYLSLVKR